MKLELTVTYIVSLLYNCICYSGICSFPDPDPVFTNDNYKGLWYEIGKIQTAGGAFFERNCVCTEFTITIQNEKNGDSTADNCCRYKQTSGHWTNVTESLYGENMSQQGRWLGSVNGGPPVNYTVISIGEDYAVEYDCGTSSKGITNYCIHVASRTNTMDKRLFSKLIAEAEAMGLNPLGLPVKMTEQDGC